MISFKLNIILHVAENDSKFRDVAPLFYKKRLAYSVICYRLVSSTPKISNKGSVSVRVIVLISQAEIHLLTKVPKVKWLLADFFVWLVTK